jgi:pSer/pThr/pTyr-binding forkhead associated (FHA) protein
MKLEKREIRQENARLRAIEKVEKQRQREELQKQKKGTLQAKLNQLAQVQAELIPTRAQRRNTSISINFSVVVEDDEQVRSPTRRGRIPRTPAGFRT